MSISLNYHLHDIVVCLGTEFLKLSYWVFFGIFFAKYEQKPKWIFAHFSNDGEESYIRHEDFCLPSVRPSKLCNAQGTQPPGFRNRVDWRALVKENCIFFIFFFCKKKILYKKKIKKIFWFWIFVSFLDCLGFFFDLFCI